MDCLICGWAAGECRLDDAWVEIECYDCQRYRVSADLYVEMALGRQLFDVIRTRAWLAWEHHARPREVPVITVHQRDLMV